MSKEKKITIAFNASIWLLFVTTVVIFICSLFKRDFTNDVYTDINIKSLNMFVIFIIYVVINVLLTLISIIICKIKENKKHKETNNL